jgi:hypothetical protein
VAVRGFELASLDVPVVCTGEASPFVSPRNMAPDMRKGVHFNILQNIWNTNYVLWCVCTMSTDLSLILEHPPMWAKFAP